MRQKAIIILTLFVTMLSQIGNALSENEIQRITNELQLSPSQRASLQIYAGEMHREWMKDHEVASLKLQKILSGEQYRKLMNHIHAMKRNHQPIPKNDEEVKAMVERYANYLLLTANQEAEFEVVALTLCHQGKQLTNQFLKRLNATLAPLQQNKLSQLKLNL